MSRFNTWRAGGVAEAVFTPADLPDLENFFAVNKKTPLLFIGHGSNLLVRDGGIGGVVIRTTGLSALRVCEERKIYAEAGVGCPKLARFCAENGLGGGEFLAAIPGTVGGALTMNAGCHGDEMWRHVHSVTVFVDGKKQERAASDFVAGYRTVSAKETNGDLFFAAARLNFCAADGSDSKQKIKNLLRQRDDSQPLGSANAGSVFRNPPHAYAAKLIESCGLKGLREGDAEVSQKHANFIINGGRARAADIEKLMQKVRQKVLAQTGVELIPEVRIVGERGK